MENIEVEFRGPVQKGEIGAIIDFLNKNAEFKEEKNRILIDYSTFLPNEGIKNRKKDIRLRVTNGVPEIIVKLGSWGGSESRKELSVLANQGDFDKLVEIFGIMGYEKGTLCVRKSNVFDYNGIEFAIVEVPNHSFYFEAEKMTLNNEEDIKNAKEEIINTCKELNLKIFNDKEFFSYINKLNEEANGVFNFNEYEEGHFKKKFNL